MVNSYEEIIEFRVTGFHEDKLKLLDQSKARNIWKAGDQRTPHTSLTHEENGVKFTVGDEHLEFGERVNKLLKNVLKHRKMLKKLGGHKQLSCVLYFSGSQRPAVYFQKKALAILAKLNASIDVDLYCVDED